jgi:hypothetical protein
MHYFGPWADPDAARAKYLDQKDALNAGRKPREATEGATVKDAANSFLNSKQALVDAGELSPRTWAEYKAACDAVLTAFGKSRLLADLAPEDFAALRARLAACTAEEAAAFLRRSGDKAAKALTAEMAAKAVRDCLDQRVALWG